MFGLPNTFSRGDEHRCNVDSGWDVQHFVDSTKDRLDRKRDDYLPAPTSAPRPSISSTLSNYVQGQLIALGSAQRRRPSISLTVRSHEVTIPPPSYSTLRFVFMCLLWYMSSAMSSNTGKVILNHFRFPITLTIIQFAFVSGLSALVCHPSFNISTLRRPTKAILWNTVPMAVFQVGGHMFSSVAISRIPVSTVHTIKALSPLFTVAAYAALFGVKYSPATYISLLPLTAGVMLACSFDVSAADFIGLVSAFGSAIVFVSSNIFFKKVMPSSGSGSGTAPPHKLDKINLLLYSSGIAFLLMIPVWVSSDFGPLMSLWSTTGVRDSRSIANSGKIVILNFFLNGVVHWGQNLIAFAVLSSTSPVTYSIASLIKRIAVICIAIIWFNQHIHPVQGIGIILAFVGLWMYNNAKGDVEKGESKVRRIEAKAQILLPVSQQDARLQQASPIPSTWPSEKVETEKWDTNRLEARSTAVPHVEFSNGTSHVHIPHPGDVDVAHTRHTPSPLSVSSKVTDRLNGHTHQTSLVQSPTGSYPSPPPSSHESPPITPHLHSQGYFALHSSDSPRGSHSHLQSLKARRGAVGLDISMGQSQDGLNTPGVTIVASS
ncbi:triose-phosphate transporter family-domain-containing protein [Cantharellus anzutake]|uniref:triose-phosphate transporter family-domain-containing protein n=1 Tax=Cantharellus anzutake TaxID=1750568 RepID=UPI0019056692|nr:triose-phosphate transporter family-domain-containing protein [Cantharellus anzutake]KAF8323505.1 triose-phosphate transporter family-domain-containing protein [Cantharellus anzutake]